MDGEQEREAVWRAGGAGCEYPREGTEWMKRLERGAVIREGWPDGLWTEELGSVCVVN